LFILSFQILCYLHCHFESLIPYTVISNPDCIGVRNLSSLRIKISPHFVRRNDNIKNFRRNDNVKMLIEMTTLALSLRIPYYLHCHLEALTTHTVISKPDFIGMRNLSSLRIKISPHFVRRNDNVKKRSLK